MLPGLLNPAAVGKTDTKENVDVVVNQKLTMREILLMVGSWYDHLGLTVAITTKYEIAWPGVFNVEDLGRFETLPPDPRVVGVHLPEKIVEYVKFVYWELARRLLEAEASLAELNASSTPRHKLTEGYMPRHEVNVSVIISQLLTPLPTTRSKVGEHPRTGAVKSIQATSLLVCST